MELRHLAYFAAVARAGTVSAASVALHVAQPSVSRQLQQLEAELGVLLFDRSSGRLALSAAGRSLLPMATDILERSDSIKGAAAYFAHGGLSRLTIAAPTVTLTDVIAPFVASLSPDDPIVDVVATDDLPSSDALSQGADLAVGTSRPTDPYRSRPLAVLPVWAYVPPTHRWTERTSVELAELLGEPLIGPPATSTARQSLDAALALNGVTWNSFTETANGTIAQALAAAGRGVAVVSDDSRYDLTPVAIILPDGKPLSIRLTCIWDARHVASPNLESWALRLGSFVTERYQAPSS